MHVVCLDVKLVEKYWKSSYSCLTDGLACFDVCDDIPNRALVSANLGRLMRQCAAVFSALAGDQNEEFSQQEKVYYDKSISYYQSALQILKNRHSHTVIWSSIQHDLSGVCYSYGSLLQDRAPLLRLSTQEVFIQFVKLTHLAVCCFYFNILLVVYCGCRTIPQ